MFSSGMIVNKSQELPTFTEQYSFTNKAGNQPETFCSITYVLLKMGFEDHFNILFN